MNDDAHNCDYPGHAHGSFDHSRLPSWVAYLAEFLQHGLWHLEQDSEKDRRLAFITIDGATEMIVRTFFILPDSVTGMSLTREQRDSMGDGFGDLLDALRRFAPDRVSDAELNDIASYHSCRNELSRSGGGSIESHKVEAYGVIATRLFTALFGYSLGPEDEMKDLWV